MFIPLEITTYGHFHPQLKYMCIQNSFMDLGIDPLLYQLASASFLMLFGNDDVLNKDLISWYIWHIILKCIRPQLVLVYGFLPINTMLLHEAMKLWFQNWWVHFQVMCWLTICSLILKLGDCLTFWKIFRSLFILYFMTASAILKPLASVSLSMPQLK